MHKLIVVFKQNNFYVKRETIKSIEFEHKQNKEVVYLLPNIETSIVLNPLKVEGNTELENRSSGLRHGTSLRQFPKRKNTGKEKIHYGHLFKFQSAEELNCFLKSYF